MSGGGGNGRLASLDRTIAVVRSWRHSCAVLKWVVGVRVLLGIGASVIGRVRVVSIYRPVS